MRRQGRAAPAHGRRCPTGRRLVRGGGVGARVALGLAFLQVADQEFELLDLAVELLGLLPEPGAPEHGELRLQLLDMQGLGVELGLQSLRKQAQLFGIGRQSRGRQRHAFV
jgi:hypothetical protein